MSIFADEAAPRPNLAEVRVGQDLSLWSLDELAQRIATLEAEIARTRQVMTAKDASRAAAESVFR